jgi:hypothetical protein
MLNISLPVGVVVSMAWSTVIWRHPPNYWSEPQAAAIPVHGGCADFEVRYPA